MLLKGHARNEEDTALMLNGVFKTPSTASKVSSSSNGRSDLMLYAVQFL